MDDVYDKYYWQNEKVRLGAVTSEDGDPELAFKEDVDSLAWAMVHEETVLPVVKKEAAAANSAAKMDEKRRRFQSRTWAVSMSGISISIILTSGMAHFQSA